MPLAAEGRNFFLYPPCPDTPTPRWDTGGCRSLDIGGGIRHGRTHWTLNGNAAAGACRRPRWRWAAATAWCGPSGKVPTAWSGVHPPPCAAGSESLTVGIGILPSFIVVVHAAFKFPHVPPPHPTPLYFNECGIKQWAPKILAIGGRMKSIGCFSVQGCRVPIFLPSLVSSFQWPNDPASGVTRKPFYNEQQADIATQCCF